MTAVNSKHIVLVPMIMWDITMFVSDAFFERSKVEIAKDFEDEEEHLLAKITYEALLVPLKQSNSPFDSASYEADFLETWAKVMDGEPLNGYTADGTPRDVYSNKKDWLSGAIVDMFAIRAFKALHGLKEDLGIKLFTWYPSAASSLFFWFGEDRIPRAEELAARTGVSFDIAAHELFTRASGRIVESPCLPTMYDYEYRPQAAYLPPEFSSNVLIQVHRVLRDTDGMITIDAADYHPQTTAAIRSWFAPRPVYYAGPLVPREPPILPTDEDAADAMRFMDARLQSHGPKSVILISFGSMFWPPNAAKVGAVLNALMDKNIPPLSVIPEETMSRLQQYEAAFVSKWIPQHAVLSHEAAGWCLTHAGLNTVFECILANVPMILWPIDADQPPNAVQLSEDLGIAYELIEVRNEAGLGTIYRTGEKPTGSIEAVKAEVRDVLARASGPDGQEKRMRLDALRTKLQAAWAQGGVARADVETFLDSL
ncbi:hypothetical protein BN946_scf185008.g14 [Trametes cinnabarina]|uniref:Glycosyltransferase Family 1 protein n=1 Tax=Pycnoporus cinnabarinus TaxID=5643 RepID=A0A060SFH3_PYCCI|nr:hypothetical protein BN946_scf185008.g14 [Trametes cinnabarina]